MSQQGQDHLFAFILYDSAIPKHLGKIVAVTCPKEVAVATSCKVM